MSRTRLLQNSLIVGSISPTLWGRIDLDKYYSAVDQAENVVIMPHGGMKRRGGLKYLASVTTGSRLFSFEFNLTQNYIFVLSITDIKVYKPNDSTVYATISWPETITQTKLDEMDIIQSADTIIITQEDIKPIYIQRQGSDSSWAIDYITFINIPKYDYDSTKSPDWFNYGDNISADIKAGDIVYNADGNDVHGLNGHLYQASRDLNSIKLNKVDFTNSAQLGANFINDGTSTKVSVKENDIIYNNDGDAVNGLTGHYYRAKKNLGYISDQFENSTYSLFAYTSTITTITNITSVQVDLSTLNYADTTLFEDLGTSVSPWTDLGLRTNVWGVTTDTINYTNDGTTQVVSVAVGDNVLNNDGNDINGLNGYVYKAVIAQVSIDLSLEDFTDASKWISIGLYDATDRGWPRTCTFHQGRLWFGGSRSKPTSVWGSVVNDFYNFDTGGSDVLPDDAIFDILDTDQFNAINNIVSGTKLQVLTAGGEFVNTEDILTPSTSSWVRYTGYGAKRLAPVNLDGATYFMDRFGKSVRNLIYSFEENGYITPPISILSEHLINGVVDLDIVRGSSTSVSNLLYLVNGDGTVAVYNTLRSEKISGWTKFTTTGSFKRVTVTNDTISFIVDRGGTEYLEVLDETILLDHAFYTTSAIKVQVDALLFANEIRVVADDITQTTIAAVNESGTYYAYADAAANELYAGLNYNVTIKTLPVSINTPSEGNIRHLPKRVTRVTAQLYNSRGVYANGKLITNRRFGDPLDIVFPLVTGQRDTYLLGYNNEGQVSITQNNPDPMTILGLDLEISY